MTARKILYIEIPVQNQHDAAKFYENYAGWIYPFAAEPVLYDGFHTDNTNDGFPLAGETGKPGAMVIYIDASEIDTDVKDVETVEEGGQVLDCGIVASCVIGY